MAKLPDALQRREQLYVDFERTDFVGQAQLYSGEGQRADALEFAIKISDEAKRSEAIRETRDSAVADGNWFLLNRIHGVEPLGEDVWRKAFDKAKSLGKLHYALKIARRLEDEASIEALELEMGIRQPEPEPVEGEDKGEPGDDEPAG